MSSDEQESKASEARAALFYYGEEILFHRRPKFWFRVSGLVGLAASVVGIIAAYSQDGQLPDWSRGWVMTCIILGIGWFLVWDVIEPMGFLVMENQRLKRNADRTRERDVFHAIAADVYGLQRTMFKESCELQLDGSADAHVGIEVQATTAKVWKLEHYVDSGTTGGDPTTDVAVEVQSITYPGGTADYKEERASRHTNIWSLVLSPALPKDRSIKYHFVEHLPAGTFVMDGDKLMHKRRRYEWSSREVIYPTKSLYLEVVFPRDWKPIDRNFQVWCDRGGIEHEHEAARINCDPDCFFDGTKEDGRYYIALQVPDPVLGLRYTLTWEPPGSGVTAVKSATPGADNEE